MITGGWSAGIPRPSQRVEIYNPKTNTSCLLPNLPDSRRSHTIVDGVICGGSDNVARTSCVDMSSGTWSSDKYAEIRNRGGHVSWNLNPGTSFMLLSGWDNDSKKTTEIVHLDGRVEPGFNLQYDIR